MLPIVSSLPAGGKPGAGEKVRDNPPARRSGEAAAVKICPVPTPYHEARARIGNLKVVVEVRNRRLPQGLRGLADG